MLSSYEHVDPASVGNTRHVLISDLAGRSNIVMKAQELGFDLSNDAAAPARRCSRAIKDLEHRGYEFEAADGSLTLLIRRVLSNAPPPFTVDAYHVSMRSEGGASVCEATVKVRVGDERAHTVADGDGPVNALDAALRAALVDLLSAAAERAADRLQGPHHRLDDRHRGDDARADPVERRRQRVGHHRRQREHRRGQPAGAGRQPRVRADPQPPPARESRRSTQSSQSPQNESHSGGAGARSARPATSRCPARVRRTC